MNFILNVKVLAIDLFMFLLSK